MVFNIQSTLCPPQPPSIGSSYENQLPPTQGFQDAPRGGDFQDGFGATNHAGGPLPPAGFPRGGGYQDFPGGGAAAAGGGGGADDELPQISANLSDIAR